MQRAGLWRRRRRQKPPADEPSWPVDRQLVDHIVHLVLTDLATTNPVAAERNVDAVRSIAEHMASTEFYAAQGDDLLAMAVAEGVQ